jgi:uncharacterized small protein (DUF1192 family)
MAEDLVGGEVVETVSEVAHDDIVRRVLEYQRRLRAGEPATLSGRDDGPGIGPALAEAVPTSPVATEGPATSGFATEEILAVTIAEEDAQVEVERGAEVDTDLRPEMAPGVVDPLAERVAELEATFDRLGAMLDAIRQDFQDLVVEVDERIGAVQREIGRARHQGTEG